jgi:hypothetical protein
MIFLGALLCGIALAATPKHRPPPKPTVPPQLAKMSRTQMHCISQCTKDTHKCVAKCGKNQDCMMNSCMKPAQECAAKCGPMPGAE